MYISLWKSRPSFQDFQIKTCFNVTVGPSVLTCCLNGTLLPELGVWTAERPPECGEV